MSLDLEIQFRLVRHQPDFAARVTAATVREAIERLTQTPLTDAEEQRRRLALAGEIIEDPDRHAETFAWGVVTRSTFNVEADLTDTAITTVVDTLFDGVAKQLVPPLVA